MKKSKLHTDKEFFLAQWFEGSLTDAEAQDFLSEKEFLAYKELQSGLLSYEQATRPEKETFDAIQERIKQQGIKRGFFSRKWVAAIAAVFVVCLGLAYFLNTPQVSIETGFAAQKTSKLLDGSEVILNAKSEMHYDADRWDNDRTVYLTGQAYFKVEKGSPFTVETDQGTVQVLGTQFDVISVTDYFEVHCYEGKVGVRFDEVETILTAGQSIRKINGNDPERQDVEDKKPSWTEGESRFKSIPLEYVILALERQYGLQFETAAIDETVVFTGSFRHTNLNLALITIFKPLEIQYAKKANNIYVLSHNL